MMTITNVDFGLSVVCNIFFILFYIYHDVIILQVNTYGQICTI